ncbi:class I glutamine amidotransferase-like protein [Microthyrium microscopicum]|uniref:Class I glutamine amidotransferase-like protein n=1 Tax=Microthyrium microscopicum TaxID=703497 RepID=A0A6A6UK12_9PEZI|nr:class I glutamine amidotransferase-like protein [Microthyrium microscopicum]
MPPSIDLNIPDRPIRVGVILLNSETEILDVGAIDLLHGSSKKFVQECPDNMLSPELKKQAVDFEFIWVAENIEAPCKLTSGIKLLPTHSFGTCPSLDIALMGAHQLGYAPSEAELEFIRKAYEESAAFITICGGFMAPLQAGIFDGKTVTSPRPLLADLKKAAPNANWVEKRWVRDGKLWTSGTLLNGLDLMAAFMRDTWGAEDTLQDFMLKLCGAPIRDVDYKDVSWEY